MHILGASRAFGNRGISKRQVTFDDWSVVATTGTLSETTTGVDRLIMVVVRKLQQTTISAKPTSNLCYTCGVGARGRDCANSRVSSVMGRDILPTSVPTH